MKLKTPLFFKVWFAIVAVYAVSAIAVIVYLGVNLIEAGPEGIGAEIGRGVKAFKEASQP